MGRKSGLRMINSSRWAKHATVMITEELNAIAEDTGANVRKIIAIKLKESYRNNLEASYGPRSKRGVEAKETHKRNKSTYTNSHDLEGAIDTVIEGDYVKVVVDKNVVYDADREVDAEKVLKWLKEGTKGGSNKKKSDKRNSGIGYYTDDQDRWHYNYPTPPHPFEEHTANDMRGLLASMRTDIENGVYTDYKYTGKKKKRTHYKGNEVV